MVPRHREIEPSEYEKDRVRLSGPYFILSQEFSCFLRTRLLVVHWWSTASTVVDSPDRMYVREPKRVVSSFVDRRSGKKYENE